MPGPGGPWGTPSWGPSESAGGPGGPIACLGYQVLGLPHGLWRPLEAPGAPEGPWASRGDPKGPRGATLPSPSPSDPVPPILLPPPVPGGPQVRVGPGAPGQAPGLPRGAQRPPGSPQRPGGPGGPVLPLIPPIFRPPSRRRRAPRVLGTLLGRKGKGLAGPRAPLNPRALGARPPSRIHVLSTTPLQ